MHLSLVLVSLAAFWTGAAVADSVFLEERSLVKRQSGSSSGAYRPSTPYGGTGKCEDNAGWVTCSEANGVAQCYRPSRGDTCCREGYACPGRDFCLTQGYCCQEGFSVDECARRYGVSVPADFQTDGAAAAQPTSPATTRVAFTTPSPEPTPDVSESSVDSDYLTETETSTETSYDTKTSTTYATAVTLPTGSGNGTSSPSTPVVPFTGAGNALDVAAGGVVAAMVLGFFGLLSNVF